MSLIDVDNCHIEPVYSTVWVASKTESEIMTTSADGTVKVSCQSVVSQLSVSCQSVVSQLSN